MITKEKLIDYGIITLIASLYIYSSILAVYIVIASTSYVLPYEVENFLSYLYFWIDEYTTIAVMFGVVGYILIYLTTLYIINKIIDLLLSMYFRIKQKIQIVVDDIINEE